MVVLNGHKGWSNVGIGEENILGMFKIFVDESPPVFCKLRIMF